MERMEAYELGTHCELLVLCNCRTERIRTYGLLLMLHNCRTVCMRAHANKTKVATTNRQTVFDHGEVSQSNTCVNHTTKHVRTSSERMRMYPEHVLFYGNICQSV